MTPAAPLWLAAPSRLAGLGPVPARWLAATVALLLAGAAIVAGPRQVLADPIHAALVESLRHGGHYYVTLRDLAVGSPEAAAALVVPTLPLVEAALPRWALALLLAALLTVILWSGTSRIAAMLRAGLPRVGAIVLLGYGLAAGTLLASALPRTGWAALLVTLALLLRRRERWIEAAAIGTAAALVDASALVATLLMAACALLDGTKREASGWILGSLLAAGAVASHAAALAALSLPAATPIANIEVSAAALVLATAFPLLPAPLAAIGTLLALLGWCVTRTPLALRIVALFVASALLDGIGTLHPIALVAPLLALGLAAAPDAIRDMTRIGGGRRRITVTRMVRPSTAE